MFCTSPDGQWQRTKISLCQLRSPATTLAATWTSLRVEEPASMSLSSNRKRYNTVMAPLAPIRCHGKPSKGLKLLAVDFDIWPTVSARPVKFPLVQPPCGKPDTHPIMHQNLHPVSAAVGKQISAMRLHRTEYIWRIEILTIRMMVSTYIQVDTIVLMAGIW